MHRSLSLLLATLAVASAASLHKADVPSNAALSCRAGFNYYQGWCVFTSEPNYVTYQGAVALCQSVGAFAPSIHSYEDDMFWSTYTGNEMPDSHFWLDAYCPAKGQRYAWMDGTPTDYDGPNHDFLDCDTAHGFHMQYNGLDKVAYGQTAPAACVYDPIVAAMTTTAVKTTHTKTTTVKTTHTKTPKPTTMPPTVQSVPPSTTPTPTETPVDYCTCNASTIYVDVVFVVDTSAQMADIQVAEAILTVKSVLSELTLGSKIFQTDVAALAYAEDVVAVRDFGTIRSASDISSLIFPYLGGSSFKAASAINQASSMIAANARNNTRGVIVLLSNSFDTLDTVNIKKASVAFENTGGILITIDYSIGIIGGLENIASPGYYLHSAAITASGTIADRTLEAMCDANCFCRDGLVSINEPNWMGRSLPNSCYRLSDSNAVYYAAEQMCAAHNGFVATTHDDDKSFFLTALFPAKTPYWIGLERNQTLFEWADGSKNSYTNWAAGNPVGSGFDCVYAQQTNGFNSPWYSAACNSPIDFSFAYVCQLPPCSSEYDCSL